MTIPAKTAPIKGKGAGKGSGGVSPTTMSKAPCFRFGKTGSCSRGTDEQMVRQFFDMVTSKGSVLGWVT